MFPCCCCPSSVKTNVAGLPPFVGVTVTSTTTGSVQGWTDSLTFQPRLLLVHVSPVQSLLAEQEGATLD